MIDTNDIRSRIAKEYLSDAEIERICLEVDRLDGANRSLHHSLDDCRQENKAFRAVLHYYAEEDCETRVKAEEVLAKFPEE